MGALLAAVDPAAPSWVWSELELWIIAPLALAAAWLVAHRRPVESS